MTHLATIAACGDRHFVVEKEIQKTREALKPGDKVVTAGGIHGRVKEVGDNYFLIEVADGVKIKVEKGSVYANPSDMNTN